jgi:hypothetical protein
MQRQPFEFEDFSWFPDTIRRSMVDYLSFFLRKTQFYKPIIPVLTDCLQHAPVQAVTDLCSGGGGPILQVQKWVQESTGSNIAITLTDKFPNTEAYEYIREQSGGSISYSATSVDATAVPASLTGMRTMFSAFHHFSPAMAKAGLKDAVAQQQPIAIFDGGDKHVLAMLGIILMHPVIFFCCTPFFRPFRFNRLLFTYLIPIIPICTVWDGIASIMRMYRPKDMLRMAQEADEQGRYIWASGKKRHPLGFHIAYLTGYPKT